MRPVWLVKKEGSLAVFGRAREFDGPMVEPGAAYEVKGYNDGSNGGSPSAGPSYSASFGGPKYIIWLLYFANLCSITSSPINRSPEVLAKNDCVGICKEIR